MFAKYSQLFDLLFISSMATLLSALRARTAIATHKETPYTTHNKHTYDYGYYCHHSLLPVLYHSNNIIW